MADVSRYEMTVTMRVTRGTEAGIQEAVSKILGGLLVADAGEEVERVSAPRALPDLPVVRAGRAVARRDRGHPVMRFLDARGTPFPDDGSPYVLAGAPPDEETASFLEAWGIRVLVHPSVPAGVIWFFEPGAVAAAMAAMTEGIQDDGGE